MSTKPGTFFLILPYSNPFRTPSYIFIALCVLEFLFKIIFSILLMTNDDFQNCSAPWIYIGSFVTSFYFLLFVFSNRDLVSLFRDYLNTVIDNKSTILSIPALSPASALYCHLGEFYLHPSNLGRPGNSKFLPWFQGLWGAKRTQKSHKFCKNDLCSLPSKESSPPSFFPRWVERFEPRSSFCRVRLANKIAGCLIKSKGTQTSLFEQSKVPISEHPGQNICVIRPYKVYCSPRNGHFFTGRNQLVGMDDSAHLGQCRHRRRVAMDWDTLRCSDLWCMVLSRFPGVKIDDFSAE